VGDVGDTLLGGPLDAQVVARVEDELVAAGRVGEPCAEVLLLAVEESESVLG